MRKKLNIWAFLSLCAMLIPIQNALGAGATVDPYTLRMTLPYVQYLGTPYYVTLDYDAEQIRRLRALLEVQLDCAEYPSRPVRRHRGSNQP